MQLRRAPLARLRALVGADATGVRQGLLALVVSLFASLVAGLVLGSIDDTLTQLPGLLILIPAATGLRGTIFGALGARLGTSIHAGTFRLSGRRQSVLRQNVLAAGALTLFVSVVLGVLAKAVSLGFGGGPTISVADFVVISLVGGCLASVVVLVITVLLAAGSVRYDWDPDNVTAPLVTASGDMVTLPSLFLATHLVGLDITTPLLATLGIVGAAVALTAGWRTKLVETRRIVRQSLVVVVVAGVLSLIAGQTLEGRLARLSEYPALLTLVPPYLAAAGSLGGILSSRLTSQLHLGLVEPTAVPGRLAREYARFAYVVGFPVFLCASLVADIASAVLDLASPGVVDIALVAMIGGFLATTFAVAVAYYGAVTSYSMGIDPDNVGIPLVTSSLDLIGSVTFVLTVVTLGIA